MDSEAVWHDTEKKWKSCPCKLDFDLPYNTPLVFDSVSWLMGVSMIRTTWWGYLLQIFLHIARILLEVGNGDCLILCLE